MQAKQARWHDQWSMMSDDEAWLFCDWIYPVSLEQFRGKDVLDCGCGSGQHTWLVAPLAKSVTAVDLNCVDIAVARNKDFNNVQFVEADIATMDLGRQFDIVFSIGVVHHTDDPDKTVTNMKKHVKPGGKLILWVYSREGNFLAEHVIEPMRKAFLARVSGKKLVALSTLITACLYLVVYSVYLLPVSLLPYYQYFQNFRRLSFRRNMLNVFDKLNAPQVQFIPKERLESWLDGDEFSDVNVSAYRGVSWRASATRQC